MPPGDLARSITTSKHDPEASWSAKDHLAHLAGIEKAFNNIIRRHIAGDPNPIGIMNNPDGSTPSREEGMTRVHAMNEAWVDKHRDTSFSEVVAGRRFAAKLSRCWLNCPMNNWQSDC